MNNSNPCVDWVFTPYPITSCPNWPPITYPTERSVTPSATGQNFIGIRLGDVSGDWTKNTATRSLRDNHELRGNSATCNLNAVAGTLKMPIVLNQSGAIENLDIEVEYDSSVMTADSVTFTGGILDGKEGYAMPFNTDIAGKVLVMIYAAGKVFTGSGEVAYINFTVSKTQSTPVLLKKFKFNNETAASGGLKINGSVCEIPYPLTCDSDYDGKYTMNDAVYYLQCIAGVRQDCICNENLRAVIQVLRVLSGM